MEQTIEKDSRPLDTAELMKHAEVIRDAIQAKSVSARQVGELFCSLIEACGDMDKALRLLLLEDVPQMRGDIDRCIAGTEEAARTANAGLRHSEQTRTLFDAFVAKISDPEFNAPERVDIAAAPAVMTLANTVTQKVDAALFPRTSRGGVLFISDNRAVTVTPDGRVTPLACGISTVHAVATADTSVYETFRIEVVPARMRLTSSGTLRLDAAGNIRLT